MVVCFLVFVVIYRILRLGIGSGDGVWWFGRRVFLLLFLFEC